MFQAFICLSGYRSVQTVGFNEMIQGLLDTKKGLGLVYIYTVYIFRSTTGTHTHTKALSTCLYVKYGHFMDIEVCP